jgi:hypothetical protein
MGMLLVRLLLLRALGRSMGMLGTRPEQGIYRKGWVGFCARLASDRLAFATSSPENWKMETFGKTRLGQRKNYGSNGTTGDIDRMGCVLRLVWGGCLASKTVVVMFELCSVLFRFA